MAQITGSGAAGNGEVRDYRYERARRKNNPPAGLAAQGRITERPAERYAYDPHRPPALRFDATGGADRYADLLETAARRPLTPDEIETLAAGLRQHEPWLEWTGKREATGFAVDPVALHIHERVAAKAILAVAARQDVQRSFFADPQLDYRQAVQFYQHDVAWANRLILGDSLQVMTSLARREDLAGQVQMIYLDPPYGIKFASNFQPQVGQRDVKDRPQDLTREPEVVKAYRDTWTLGVHSYLAYLRDRLIAARELLAETGSIFVQIGSDNIHLMRTLLDEVFAESNFISQITVQKTAGQDEKLLNSTADYVLWYAMDKENIRYYPLFAPKSAELNDAGPYSRVVLRTGERRSLSSESLF